MPKVICHKGCLATESDVKLEIIMLYEACEVGSRDSVVRWAKQGGRSYLDINLSQTFTDKIVVAK